MARRLKLTKYQVTEVNYQFLGAFRLRVEVTDPTDSGADPYVFVYNRRPVNPYNQEVTDDFHAVASPGDLAEYPVGEPNGQTAYPFFRLDYVELDFRSTEQAERVWQLIVAEVDVLMKSLDRMETLVPTDETWVGAAPDAGASDSASLSDSTSA
jgi:hypothetical protein